LKRIATLILVSSAFFGLPAFACEPHWITGIYDGGEIIQLENNTLWKTFDLCLPEAATWEAGDNVEVCDDKKMRNMDKEPGDHEWVLVKQLSPSVQTRESNCDPGK